MTSFCGQENGQVAGPYFSHANLPLYLIPRTRAMVTETPSRTFFKWTISFNPTKSTKTNTGCLDFIQQDPEVLREKHMFMAMRLARKSEDSNLCLLHPPLTDSSTQSIPLSKHGCHIWCEHMATRGQAPTTFECLRRGPSLARAPSWDDNGTPSHLALHMGSGDQTQYLMLVWQALSYLAGSQLPPF